MKVAVLTVADVQIGRWRWWSDWIDIAVFDFGSTGYLLQMKISRTNSKRFKARAFSGLGNAAAANCHQAGDLTQMQKQE